MILEGPPSSEQFNSHQIANFLEADFMSCAPGSPHAPQRGPGLVLKKCLLRFLNFLVFSSLESSHFNSLFTGRFRKTRIYKTETPPPPPPPAAHLEVFSH